MSPSFVHLSLITPSWSSVLPSFSLLRCPSQSRGARQCLRLCVKDTDGLVQPRDREYLLVMLAQPVRKHTLLEAIHANEECDQQADPTTVHVVHLAEIEEDRHGGTPGVFVSRIVAGWGTGLHVGVHQRALSKRRKLAQNGNNTDPL